MYAEIKAEFCNECKWKNKSESYCAEQCRYRQAKQIMIEFELKALRDKDKDCNKCANKDTCNANPSDCIKDTL